MQSVEETEATFSETNCTAGTPTPNSTEPPTEPPSLPSTSASITIELKPEQLKPVTVAEVGLPHVKSTSGEVDQHRGNSPSLPHRRTTTLSTPDSLGALSGAFTEDSPQHSCRHHRVWFGEAHANVPMETLPERMLWWQSQTGEMEDAREGGAVIVIVAPEEQKRRRKASQKSARWKNKCKKRNIQTKHNT